MRLNAPGFAAVITDDVQYYNPATVELGAFFLTQSPAPGEPGEVPRHVITYRRGSLPAHTQARIDALVEAGVAARIALDGLDVDDTCELLRTLDVPADGPQLARQPAPTHGRQPAVSGNPAPHVPQRRVPGRRAPEPPGGYGSPDGERLAGLSGTAIQVARGAAVLGDHFTLELLGEVLGLGLLNLAGAWEELERAQVTVGERFSHDVVREAVLAGMPDTIRTVLHRAAARTLAHHGEHPGRVARHWHQAGDIAQAVGWLMRAGAAAQSNLRLSEAVTAYAAAADAYASLGDAARETAARGRRSRPWVTGSLSQPGRGPLTRMGHD